MTVTNPALSDALDPYRLPRHTLPTRYDLVLEPDLAAASFSGTARIAVTCSDPVEMLVLNAIELEIGRVEVDGSAAAWQLEQSTERLFVTPSQPLDAGDHVLAIEFTGVLNDRLKQNSLAEKLTAKWLQRCMPELRKLRRFV